MALDRADENKEGFLNPGFLLAGRAGCRYRN